MYMSQAFAPPTHPLPPMGTSLESTLVYLDAAQRYVLACLESLDEADLGKPVPTTCHGQSAANLFRVLTQHDINHSSQIEVLREETG